MGSDQLTTKTWGEGSPEIIFLHDGLGSIAQWRDVPGAVAAATGRTVMAYDRAGHGASKPTPSGPWPADWLHHEAEVLSEVLNSAGADKPLLVGHSDGGSIALVYAASRHASDRNAARGVLSLAAHAYVETVTVDAIKGLRANTAAVTGALGRHHNEPEAIFEAWSGVWVGDDFAPWDIRTLLADVEMPVLAVQGDADEYASPDHVAEIAAAIGPNSTSRLVPGIRHLMHHDDPDLVVDLVVEMAAELFGTAGKNEPAR